MNVTVDVIPLQKLIQTHGVGRLIDLNVNGERKVVLLRDVQREPVRGSIEHVDFHAVALDTEVRAAVPVVIIGEETRQNDGGVVTQSLREVEVSCLPTDIPERIEIDVSSLTVGDTLTVADMVLPDGVEAQTEPEEVVVSITIPAAVEEPEEEAEDAEAEAEEGDAEEASADEDA